MKISTKGRYALRMMIDLAQQQKESVLSYIPLKDIAFRQGIEIKYLEQIVALLKKDGLIQGVRGSSGGYRLTKAPEQYTVGSILRLTEESMAPVSCLEPGAAACPRAAECRTLSLWKGLDKVISDYLEKYTLADLMHTDPDGYDYII